DFRFYADGTAPVRPVLATLQVKSTGLMQGQTFELRSPLTHIGRGAYNDVVLPDDSVSDLHAKVQLREGGGGWVVVDMGSTNGTYIGGRRIVGEARIEGAPDLRVGGIKFIFRPTGVDAGGLVMTESDAVEIPESAGAGAGHTRAIAALTPEQRARFAGPGVADTGASSAAGTGGRSASPAPLTARGGGGGGGGGSERGRGASLLFWVVVLVVAAIAVVLLLF
ncbi:MAG TPA: FHA domain-containing protein, partial [Gemmatimonadaceae bacterium]